MSAAKSLNCAGQPQIHMPPSQVYCIMKKRIITIFAISGLCFHLQAQQIIQPQPFDENSGIIYSQEFATGLRLHSNGFAFGITKGHLETYYRTRFFHAELGELKHPKEDRQSFDNPGSINGRIARPFKFGKQNNFYVLRGGLGVKRYFSEKAKHKGVAVGLVYEGGVSLGILKPYYLELRATDGIISTSTKYSTETADRFLDINQILGASGWTKGLGELSLLPGAHGKLGVHFDWGAFDEYVKAIEAGMMVDVFSKKAPIMVETGNVQNSQVFINLFIHLQFGKRW